MNTQSLWSPIAPSDIPMDVYKRLQNEPDVAGVAVWEDSSGVTYVMGYVNALRALDGGASLPGQIESYIYNNNLPSPCGCWTLYTREGYRVIH